MECEVEEMMATKSIWDPKKAIRSAVQKKRLAHAYLLCGPDLEYLRMLACWTSQLLLCGEDLQKRPCGTCLMCEKIRRGVYPDLHWVEPQGSLRLIKIAQIRKLQQEASLKPFDGKMKIVVLVEASAMNAQASNAFLKTLEEPPKQTLLLVLTTRLEKVLPTVQSRCQVLRCYPVGLKEVSKSSIGDDVKYKDILLELAGYNGNRLRLLLDSGLWKRRECLLDRVGEAMRAGDIMILGAVDALLRDLDDFQKQLEGSYHDSGFDLSDKHQEMEFKAHVEGALNSEIKEILQTLVLFFQSLVFRESPLLWSPIVEAVEETQTMLNRAGNRRLVFENFFFKAYQILGIHS